MAAEVVSANYEMLEQVSSKFTQQGDAISQMLQNVRAKMDALQGQWIGKGSEAFFAEMADEILPACDRLQQALEEAGTTTKQMSEVLGNAEDEAANAFQVAV